MSKKIFYDEIGALLTAHADVHYFALWNNQPENDDYDPVYYPVVYLSFNEIAWFARNQGCQETSDLNVMTLRIVIHDVTTDPAEYLDTIDSIVRTVNNQSTSVSSVLTRVAERQDEDHDSLIIWEIDFSYKLRDESLSPTQDYTTKVTPTTLDIGIDAVNDAPDSFNTGILP